MIKLDLTEINHNYITRIVIFALFTYKILYKQPSVYKQSVLSFCSKRIPWDVKLEIDTGPETPKDDRRESVIDSILYDSEIGINVVTAYYTTGLKKVSLNVNLEDEEKYQIFLYS